MPYEQIANAVATLGFPIVACCVLFYMYSKIVKAMDQTLMEIVDTLNEIKKDIKQLMEDT